MILIRLYRKWWGKKMQKGIISSIAFYNNENLWLFAHQNCCDPYSLYKGKKNIIESGPSWKKNYLWFTKNPGSRFCEEKKLVSNIFSVPRSLMVDPLGNYHFLQGSGASICDEPSSIFSGPPPPGGKRICFPNIFLGQSLIILSAFC